MMGAVSIQIAYNQFSEPLSVLRVNPDNQVLWANHYTYDNHGNLTRLTDNALQTTDFTSNTAGFALSTTDGNGHTTTFQRDSLNRVVSATDAGGYTQQW